MEKKRLRLFTAIQLVFVLIFILIISLLNSCSEEPQPNNIGSNAAVKGGKVGTFDAPVISCVEATQTSITIRVTAGATGAPAGFSLHWTSKKVLDSLNGVWPSSESGLICTAGFSGNANGYVFNLSPGESTSLTIGNVLFDTPGANSSCIEDLLCGTEYVFRAFAHATSNMFRSAWSVNQVCRTTSCKEICVYGQGWWKNHGPVPSGNNAYVWPQSVKDNGLVLGSVTYTALQLQNILQTPGATNGLIKLAHQLIAAKLNVANGANASSISSSISSADGLIGSLVVPPIGSGALTNAQVAALNNALDSYNSGKGEVSYCEDQDGD